MTTTPAPLFQRGELDLVHPRKHAGYHSTTLKNQSVGPHRQAFVAQAATNNSQFPQLPVVQENTCAGGALKGIMTHARSASFIYTGTLSGFRRSGTAPPARRLDGNHSR